MKPSEVRTKLESLTPKQQKVLSLMFEEKNNDSIIAAQLKIEEPTVRKHIQNLCDHFEIPKKSDGIAINRREHLLKIKDSISLVCNEDQEKDLPNRTINRQAQRNLWRQLPKIYLPSQTNEFIGRKEEIEQLLRYISLDYRAPIITIDGIGGVGKTALALEVAYRCLEASIKNKENSTIPKYDSIIFVSAKDNYLLPEGIISRPERDSNLQDIFRVISQTLDNGIINQLTGELRVKEVYEALGQQSTLLIVDNMETIDDKNDVVSFLSDLPASTKAIITTRERVILYGSLRLDSLPEEDSLKLIHQQSVQKGVSLSDDESKRLYEFLGGVPVAIIYAIGQLSRGYTLEGITNFANKVPENIAHYCFKASLEKIKDTAAHKLLMGISVFRRAPTLDALVKASGLQTDMISVETGLAELQQLSLVSYKNKRCKILPITREFALSELVANEAFENKVRKRWLGWYETFAETNGNRDWEEWQIQYDKIDDEWPNLIAVLDWCAAHDRYEDIKELWFMLNQFASLYGYWADRLYWLSWLYKESERRGKLGDVYYAKVDQAYTLIEMNQLERAQSLLLESWKLRQLGSDTNRIFLTQNIALLRIQQKKYKSAILWVETAEDLVKTAKFTDRTKKRREIVNLSRKAEAYYHLGKKEEANKLFESVLKQSEDIGWQRQKNIARRQLAEVALANHQLQEAENLLSAGYGETLRNKAKKDIAEYQRAFALLEKVKGNTEKSHDWAKQAIAIFKDLGMKQQESGMHALWLAT
ncbi:MAG: NB-ARC domain-containing protein [Cyanobacteria bacterium P01_F01_bin.116]